MTQVVNDMDQENGRGKAPALKGVVDLFETLNQRGVRYCHWKSNSRLERGLRGQTDLDLLVDREHSGVFRQLLDERQIKRVLASPGKRYPAVEDYLGFDPAGGRLFHLHAHYQLVLGEQFVKNYSLPLEELFLNSVHLHHGVNVPAPELELIVLSLRALLKYRDRDALKDVLSIRSPGIPAHILGEIRWLLGQTSIQDVWRALAEIPDVIPPDVVLEFLETVVASPRDGYTLYCLRQRARRALGSYQRHGRFHASSKYFRELWRRRKSFLRFGPSKGMTLPSGGVTVALVGVDGAGKTTLCQELRRWLALYMDVHLYYLGSKQPSWLSEWLYLLFRIARRGHRTISGLLGEKNPLSRSVELARQALLYSHYLSVGYDRYRRYLAGRREASAGSIAVFDRFPLEAPLDGPEIHLASNGHNRAAAGLFSRWERKLYRGFEMPDLLVLLDVSPEVSMQRKPDHRGEAIEAKNRALRALRAGLEASSSQGNWAHLNADLPFEGVLNQLKQVIWAAL